MINIYLYFHTILQCWASYISISSVDSDSSLLILKFFCRSNDLSIKLWLNHLCSVEGAFSSSNTFSSGMNTNSEAHCARHTCHMVIFPVKDTEKLSKSSFSSWSIICVLYGQPVTTQLFKIKCILSYWSVGIYKHRDDPPSYKLKM